VAARPRRSWSWPWCTALALGLALATARGGWAQGTGDPDGTQRVTGGRFTFVATPRDIGLARNLLADAAARDTFPGLARPRLPATVWIAPDERTLHTWIGAGFPEWGAAVAFPEERRIIMQGQGASSRAGDPRVTLRHELAHLALAEAMGRLAPRWFDEGFASYAAGEWGRDDVLSSSVVLALRGVPHFSGLDSLISGGTVRAEQGYALAHLAVADLAAKDPRGGLALLFRHWAETRSLDQGLRRAYGGTLDGFEDEWRRATRTRYGALAILADLSFATLVLFIVVGPFWLVRRRRDRARLAAMRAADEAAERRERESALEALLGGGEAPGEHPPGNEDRIKGG
jgi:hypothetical protein